MNSLIYFALSSITSFYITRSILRKNKFHSELKTDDRTPEAEEINQKALKETRQGNFNGYPEDYVNKRLENPLHQFQKVETTYLQNFQHEQETILHQRKNGNEFKNLNSKTSSRRSVVRKTLTPYFDIESAEIKLIRSVPDNEHYEPKRISFLPGNEFEQIAPYKYPVAKMPRTNCLIKFPRKGRSEKKGFKEDEFKQYLNRYFGQQYSVLNDRHVPTESGRPYEPDFVLSNERDGKAIFINIEIDEPYDGWLRTPTHCEGENDLRDEFFIKRGWIVIRFAEIQIHQEPIACCAFISQVIRSIDNSFNSSILEANALLALPQWSSLQAKKWEVEKYREKYLEIEGFGKRPNIILEYEIEDSEADKAVESEVPRVSQIHKPATNYTYLSSKNKHTRDNRVTFDPDNHRYYIDGNPDTISVTQLVDKFFPEFDVPYWAAKKAIEKGISAEEIIAEWEKKKEEAAMKGTALHEAIEYHYNDNSFFDTTKEFKQFLDFKLRYNFMIPFRTEWRIFEEDLLVAGTIDMVFKKEDGSLFIFDWKRSKKVVGTDGTLNKSAFQVALGELEHLGNNSYNKYCLQQNIYKTILEKRYNQRITSMNLLIMHEDYDNYHIVQIPEMQNEVKYIFSHLLSHK